jgi:hypothetical protein
LQGFTCRRNELVFDDFFHHCSRVFDGPFVANQQGVPGNAAGTLIRIAPGELRA